MPAGRINSAAGTDAHRHADQLLRAAGGRLDLRGRRRPPRHLHRADRGRRDHAPRRRRRLRLLLASARRAPGSSGTQSRARGPVSLHARVRPLLRDGRIGRRAPRRADGRAALRPPGHRGVHPRQGPGRPDQLQHLGRRDRRLHAGGARPTATSSWCTRPSPSRRHEGRRRLPARRRPVGLPQGARARPVGPDHALDLRPRRAGHPVPRPHQPRQQPQLLRDHRGHQPLRRAAAAALRLLLPRLDRPDALRARRRSPTRPSFDFAAFGKVVDVVDAHARQRARRHRLAAGSSSRKPAPSAASAWASPAWATR